MYNIKDNDIDKLVQNFVEKYKDFYTKDEYRYLTNAKASEIKPEYMIDILRQIYEEKYIYKEEYSAYSYFIKLIEQEKGLEKNIVEVGGGIIPSLAKKISIRQGKGTITIYDPRLNNYYKENNRFILKKELFTEKEDIRDKDLIIGFMPCEATETIIRTATNNKKDFMIAMCEGGPHGDYFDYFEDEEEWLSSMICFANSQCQDNNLGKIKILEFPKRYNINYPIITNVKEDNE